VKIKIDIHIEEGSMLPSEKTDSTSESSFIIEHEENLGYDRRDSDPYTIAFCYPKSGPVLVRGGKSRVEKYISDEIQGVFHYRISQFVDGQSTGVWKTNVPELLFFRRYPYVDRHGVSKPREQLLYRDAGNRLQLISTFKRPPHSYIVEFDKYDSLVEA
jgi:hypothetical protein